MNLNSSLPQPARVGCLTLLLAAGLGWLAGLPVSAAPVPVENRYLLVFDTAAAMKPTRPVVQELVGQLFITMMNGNLKTGDSIGVWTFATKVGTRELPLQVWRPENAATIASNIVSVVQDHRYARTTDFKEMLTLLDPIVRGSDRLTVIIFCDGSGQFAGTPYADAINAVFKQDGAAMQKAKRPFVVVLRSQFGDYVGCKVTLGPDRIIFPDFPPLPEAPVALPYAPVNPAPPSQAAVSSPAPASTLPPLVIVGTQVGTNPVPDNVPVPKPAPDSKPAEPATNAMVISPTPVRAPVVTVTNVVTVTDTVAAAAPPAPVLSTNLPAIPSTPDLTSSRALVIGAGLLATAVVLTIWMMRNVRETARSSLITRSLDQKNNPPAKA